uniref:8-amino-7-oxononanoate synthase (Kbl, GCAT) n=1 Tax=uncultured marine thaumarchaeote KM3_69_B11 TaxID=1456244 RepID=A0A075HM01_9ARCH|nr:8-amino-7-oxononanoate synthase (kbl, GCAT) [uncultured marine thaumarchaeote KM3_69_B11]
MKHKLEFIKTELNKLKNDNLFRELQNTIVNKQYIHSKNKKLLNLSSNDYLGLNIGSFYFNQFQSSSRSVTGNDNKFLELEKKLAKHKSQEKSLVYPTGYMANLGAISAIIEKHDTIFSDELNHASIIEACRLTSAKIKIYKHNDMHDLESKIKKTKGKKFIITEGVFSMDGDLAKIKEITEISSKHDIITILDDAHGDFVFGQDGKGTANQFRVDKKIDLYVSSLSKGLGSFGGYISAQKNIIELCINRSKSFIYTSALPSPIIEFTLKRFNANREQRRKKLWSNIKLFHNGLQEIGYETKSSSQIIPIIIGNEKTALEFGKYLFKNGIFAQPIRFPTVKKNSARIRFSITAWHTNKQINETLSVIEKCTKKFKII